MANDTTKASGAAADGKTVTVKLVKSINSTRESHRATVRGALRGSRSRGSGPRVTCVRRSRDVSTASCAPRSRSLHSVRCS